MLESLSKNQEIHSFLKLYPKAQWNQCLEAIIVYGVQTLQKKYPYGLSYQLLLSITGLDLQLERNHSHSNLRTNSEKSKKEPKTQDSTKKKRPESSKVLKSSSSRPSLYPNSKRNYQEVPSKIKEDVNKDIAIYKYKMEVSRTSLKGRNESEDRRSSGIQTDRSYGKEEQTPSWENKSLYNEQNSHKSKIQISEKIKEPKTVALETAKNLFRYVHPTKEAKYKEIPAEKTENKVLKIADQFLKNPVTSYLAKNQGMFSVPHSPKFLERLMSPESNLLSSVEMLSPTYYMDT
ncbi:unnamed protein product [Blepharisma stoltei]|uniref:Uncharacterized protein n=1 Tax=Blepharisma stoltei TaxID=1481888 RepID=A0AAU9IHV3_9CILI|nr:unnamed protein product [Blepharisma stoltei]